MNNKSKNNVAFANGKEDLVRGTELAIQNELKKEAREIALTNTNWGASEIIDTNDITVGKILHQQALSKFVQDGVASAGDWCDSLTGEVLCKRDDKFGLIVFHGFKKLIVSKVSHRGDKISYEAQDVTPANVNLPWSEEVKDGIIKRQLQYNYFCLIPAKINDLPYVLSLTSSKIKIAKKLNTMIAKLARLNKPSASTLFNFISVKESGEKGSWYGMDVIPDRYVSVEELHMAHYWYEQVKNKANIKVADEAVTSEPTEMSVDEYFNL